MNEKKIDLSNYTFPFIIIVVVVSSVYKINSSFMIYVRDFFFARKRAMWFKLRCIEVKVGHYLLFFA